MTPRSDLRASTAPTLDLDRLLRYAAAALVAVAGLGHLSAAGDHPAHPHIAAFFVIVALAQIGWAAAVAWRPRQWLLLAGVAGNAVVVVVWIASRTTGIPLVPGAGHVEAVATKDAATTFAELAALGALGLLLLLGDAARRVSIAAGDRAVAAVLALALLFSAPAVLGSHGHGADHGAHGHAPGEAARVLGETAAGHDHGEGSGHDAVEVPEQSGEVVAHELSHAPKPTRRSAGAHAHGAGDAVGGHAHADGPALTDAAGPTDAAGWQAPSFAGAPGRIAVVRYGPFVLPPASTNGPRHEALISNTVLSNLPPPCRGCVLTAIDVDLVYEDGRRANFDTGAMLHHHVMFNSGEDDPTCGRWDPGIGFAGRRIFAAGNERTVGVFPEGFGYEVGRNDWWTGIFEIMNTVEQPQDVWVQVTVKHVPAGGDGIRLLEPVWLDVDNCEDSEYAVPAGRSTTSWDWTSTMTGRILSAGGHVHDGGLSIGLANQTAGEHVCKSVAGYGSDPAYEGHIESMSTCSWDRIGRMRRGDVLRMSTLYDVPEAADDVMGIMMIWVYETDDLDGGTPAPAGMTDPPESGAPPPPGGHHH